jgi:hypothetical protein
MTITNEVKRSWADIVTGSTSRAPPARIVLEPAARGERRCLCQGEILVMLGHYGWIMALDDIEHPDVDKTGGRIYVHKRDVVDGVSLVQGDVVSFYLYADDQGLGAERCSLKQSVEEEDDCGHSIASAFPNWNTRAKEFVPAAETVTPSTFNVQATVFVPSYDSFMDVDVIEFVPATIYSNIPAPKTNFLAINPAFLSDDESDDGSSTVSNDDFSGNEGDKESVNSDDESLSSMSVHSWQIDKEWSPCLDVVVLSAPLKPSRCSSDNDSTSVGAESNSDDEDSEMPWAKLSNRLAVRLHSRLATKLDMFSSSPLGLSLPADFRPPPGLSLPACVS